MKRKFLLTISLLLVWFIGNSFAGEVTVFGPNQYLRASGSPNFYSDTFSAVPGQGTLIVRNGSYDGSNRIMDSVSSASVSVNGVQIFGTNDFNKNIFLLETSINLQDENTISIELGSAPGTYLTIEIKEDIDPPTVSIAVSPDEITSGDSAVLSWESTNADTCSITPEIGSVPVSGSMNVSPEETIIYTITAQGLGGSVTNTATLSVIDPATAPEVFFDETSITIEQGSPAVLSWTSNGADTVYIDNGIGSVAVSGSVSVSLENTTTYTITATSSKGSSSDTITVYVAGNPEPLPEGSFGAMYQDIIPADATVEAYDSKRFSLVTGVVNDIDDNPVQDVNVMVYNHPEYGTAATDIEGRYTLPVEGGGTLTLVFRKEGYITSHRQVQVPWNDFAVCETVQMVLQDPKSTIISFDGNPDTIQTHDSTIVADEFGSRSSTLVFSGDNRAFVTDDQGNDISELATISVRATEFEEPNTMPAKLPPTSAYTYCIELQVDGADRVRFEKPVPLWVDNFLGFDVGEIVPVGYYDRDRAVWVPSDNGVVVRLLDTDNNDITDALDATGDGQPDDLDNNGSFANEVAGLDDPARYQPDTTFWRSEITHFTPWDCNWPYGPPQDAIPPNPVGEPYLSDQKSEEEDCRGYVSSYIEERSRIFHEDIPIPGTEMTLHYASNRVSGYKDGITVPASGDSIPPSLKKIHVKLEIAGRIFYQSFDALPNQTAMFEWNGLDRLGKKVGSINAHISIGFEYELIYYSARESIVQAFTQTGTTPTDVRGRKNLTSWKHKDILIKKAPPINGTGTIAKGWTVPYHHQVSPTDLTTLHKGGRTIIKNNVRIINRVAGNGTQGHSGDGGPAVDATFTYPRGVAVDSIGNIYIADTNWSLIRKIDTNGIITTVAGNTISGYGGDGGPATEASLDQPVDVDVDNQGNIYIADRNNDRIRKIDTNGIITTVAGGGYWDDGWPAIEASLDYPSGVAVDNSDNIYIADTFNNSIRKVDTNGIISTVAGTWMHGYNGDGGPATQASLYYPFGVAVDNSGNIYIADMNNDRVRKVDSSGIITTIAGGGTNPFIYNSGPATEAVVFPYDVAVDNIGNIYIADSSYSCIRKVDTSGIITTLAGGTFIWHGSIGDGAPARDAWLWDPHGVAIDNAGDIYIADTYSNIIRKIGPVTAFKMSTSAGDTIFPEENGTGHVFSTAGLHTSTIDLDTGVILRGFGYNENNLLISITDQFNNQTTINRNANGAPVSVTSPDSLTTWLTTDTDNHLTNIAYPDGSEYDFDYNPEGLLLSKTEPNGNRFDHVFDVSGRLTNALDEEGGHWQFDRTALENGDILTEVLTGEGNQTSYLDNTDSTGAYTSTITDPTGGQTQFSQSADDLTANKNLSCGMNLEFKYGLDPEYKFKFVKEIKESTPSGLERITLKDKTYQDTDLDEIPDLITQTVTINGKNTTIENNVLQSQKTVTSPLGRTTTISYNPSSLVTEIVKVPNLFDTSYEYDSKGRLISMDIDTRGVDYTYNVQGFLDIFTDAENRTTGYHYDEVGRVKQVNRPDTTSLWFSYDNNGNITVLTNPSTIDHGFGFNKVNLNNAYQTPLSGSYNYTYDKDRRLISKTFPSLESINYIYDNARLSQVQVPEGNIDYTYYCGTKIESITKVSESVTYGYDGKLVTSETLAGTLNQNLAYTWNNDFNLTGFTYAGSTASYAYDNDSLLTGSGNFTIARNAQNGLPESVTGGSLNLARTFNGHGEADILSYIINSQNLTTWNLTRDNNGRIIHKSEAVNSTAFEYDYAYDSMGRLLSVTKDSSLVEEYQYSANGTRIYEMNTARGIAGRILSYSDGDHLLTAGTTTYQYNVNGFLESKTNGTDVTDYMYSSRGELLSVTLPDGTLIEYVHDPLGRKIAKKVNGTVTEKYLWQGLTRLLAVYDGADNLVMRFEYADARMPVAMTAGGNTYYLTFDQVGSLKLVADSSGNVVKQIEYDTFGNIISDSNPAFEIPFGFAGGLHDRHTKLVRFGYRDYDPETSRWTAKDPILFAGGDTDLYGYVLNDPVNFIDPLGLYWFRQDWQTPGQVGRENTFVEPGGPISEFIEKYDPAGYTFGEIHDSFLDFTKKQGIPDSIANYPSMIPLHYAAFWIELLRSLGIIEQPIPQEKACE